MLWSFPALLDIDLALAREALDYALTVQLHNTGTHSRFIDGIVLEAGFQLDEAVAPILALAAYVRVVRSNDDGEEDITRFLPALNFLKKNLLSRFNSTIGLFTSLQDSQDEYQKLPYLTYDNVLTWRALQDMAEVYTLLGLPDIAKNLTRRAADLKAAIMARSVARMSNSSSLFASATDGGLKFVLTEIPPGSLMKLPTLGFIAETDPLFVSTYDYLHSPAYKYSFYDQPYATPGSYRVPFTTCWMIADELRLQRSRGHALKILVASPWDNGIVTEGLDPATAEVVSGQAFATAAGYVAHSICKVFCKS